MLNVKLVCVGSLKEAYLRDAVKEYEKRLGAYCRFSTAELKDDSQLPDAVDVKRAYKIALCVEGKQHSSEEFARILENTAEVTGSLVLVIGGSDGLPESVKAMCDYRLSFSRMTFPHQLMRVILLEQLYRGFNINHNGKYHK
ncbi:MAG: 23S rRNA (pseudouridine(1915)-N(3))-methyltransferase RlmH [Clostridia bacterium]|nr:23S rRNA (pseudouridine(1915)-N(3))-methyltransferase RlmH [Clostridia bacterium]